MTREPAGRRTGGAPGGNDGSPEGVGEETFVVVARASLGDAAARRLEAAQTAEIAARYGTYTPGLLDPSTFAPPEGGFFVARVGPEVVGGGGFRRHDRTSAELKLLRVEPSWRRRGIARRLLSAIEGAAGNAGYRTLVLETGTAQPEALTLYRSTGYRPIAPYGPDRDLPAVRCLAKDFAPPEAPRRERLDPGDPELWARTSPAAASCPTTASWSRPPRRAWR